MAFVPTVRRCLILRRWNKLSAVLRVPVFMEGKVWRPEEALAALQAGAQNVVVGSAITRPQLITESYTSAVEQWLADHVINN